MHESFYRELQLSNILCLYGVYWDEYVSFNKFHLSNFGDWRIYIGLTVYLPRHSVALAQVYRWRTNIYIITVSQDREWPMKKLQFGLAVLEDVRNIKQLALSGCSAELTLLSWQPHTSQWHTSGQCWEYCQLDEASSSVVAIQRNSKKFVKHYFR